ncbi:MAG TPA: EI24 domain-containing protein [Leptospiraceae bacterium]|jgi:uncharacterized protein involved in cysteine biosynthesis|nr:EI24 domain-containing protein [Leptospirales bacterium]HMU81926.1 EI24 domain-containing protein [Leptospiraceae bacterium]HMX56571.1 EI24 domain-containing protein [Leptospiraceae bacterium]HMY45661.1 EI24 domain-containing protein [Leptospiraceae bacterium]HNE24516.1 EI24 domain-containing protein [Leptospiraceae bacterium]
MLSRLAAGFRAYFSSLGFLRKNNLLSHIFLPALAGLLVVALLGACVIFFSGGLSESIFLRLEQFHDLPDFVRTSLRLLFIFAGLVLTVIAYRPLSSMLVLPFIGPILAQVEKVLLGKEIETTVSREIKNAMIGGWLGVQASIAALFIFVITLPLGPVQAPVMFLVNSYILGKSAFDFIFEKETGSVAERRAITKKYRPEILGVGIGFILFLLVPIAGAALAPIFAVVAAARIRHGSN